MAVDEGGGKKPFPGRAALMGTERQVLLVAAYGQVKLCYVIDWRTHTSWYEVRGGRGRAVEREKTPFDAEWRFDKTCRELYDGEAE